MRLQNQNGRSTGCRRLSLSRVVIHISNEWQSVGHTEEKENEEEKGDRELVVILGVFRSRCKGCLNATSEMQ